MFAANRDKADADGFIGRVLKDLGRVFLEGLVFIGDQLGLCNVFRWLQDEAQHNATMRELNLHDDYCLDDIGIKRPSPDSFYSRLNPEVMRIDVRRLR